MKGYRSGEREFRSGGGQDDLLQVGVLKRNLRVLREIIGFDGADTCGGCRGARGSAGTDHQRPVMASKPEGVGE